MAKSQDQIVNNWASAMADGRTQQKYKDGINGYNGNPMAMAATDDALQRYAASCQNSVSSGRRAAALNAANPATWKTNATTVGAQRLASGGQKGKARYMAAMQKWAPIYTNISQTVASMPKGGLANAQARANRAIEMLMQAAGKS
jgi:hypothetical protein